MFQTTNQLISYLDPARSQTILTSAIPGQRQQHGVLLEVFRQLVDDIASPVFQQVRQTWTSEAEQCLVHRSCRSLENLSLGS